MRFFISSITVAELYQGVIEGDERSALDSMMSAFTILPVTKEIAKEGRVDLPKISKNS